MIPKVEACLDSLEAGVRKTHIIDGRLRHSLLLEMYTDDRDRHRDRLEATPTTVPKPARPSWPAFAHPADGSTARRAASGIAITPPDARPASHARSRRNLERGALTLAQVATSEFGRDDRPVRSLRDPQLPALPGLPGPGRRVVGLGRRGEALPRLLPRLGLQPARPLPAAGRRGGPRAGRPADPRAEHLVHRGAGGVRPGALGAVVRRPVLLLQQRRRGQRGGHQAGPGLRPRRRAGTRSSRWRAASTAGPTPRSRRRPSPSITPGFEPMVPGFTYVPYDDLDAVAARRSTTRRPPSWSSRSRARGGSTSRRPATCRASASSATSGACC